MEIKLEQFEKYIIKLRNTQIFINAPKKPISVCNHIEVRSITETAYLIKFFRDEFQWFFKDDFHDLYEVVEHLIREEPKTGMYANNKNSDVIGTDEPKNLNK